MRADFLRRADFVDFQMPITVRLNPATDASGDWAASDDQLQIAWDTQTAPWPIATGVPWAPVTTSLTGGFTMQWNFGGDASGYGGVGVFETTQGQGVSMQGTPFSISGLGPACASVAGLDAVARRALPGPVTFPACRSELREHAMESSTCSRGQSVGV